MCIDNHYSEIRSFFTDQIGAKSLCSNTRKLILRVILFINSILISHGSFLNISLLISHFSTILKTIPIFHSKIILILDLMAMVVDLVNRQQLQCTYTIGNSFNFRLKKQYSLLIEAIFTPQIRIGSYRVISCLVRSIP